MTDSRVRLERLERILDVSRDLNSTVALAPLLHKIVEMAGELTDSEAASILLLDKRTGELRFRAASGDPNGQLKDVPVPVEDSIAGAVLLSDEPMIISDVRTDPRHYAGVARRVGRETHSLLAVPLRIKERQIGVVEAINKLRGDAFDQEDIETLNALAAQAAVAIENARLVEALRKANERLGELDRLKSEFIAIASHELRTPLSLILLYAGLLRERMEGSDDPQLDAVLRAAAQLRHIIETMLNLRHLETGEMELTPEQVDLCTEINEACHDHKPVAESENVTIRQSLPEERVIIEADREKLRLVLDNLISNAIKFADARGEVHVSLVPDSDVVEVRVRDNGIGIPEEELERVFDRFYQVEDHMKRRYGGMGLGLSIVRGLVDLHGGHVWAESVPEGGSLFVVKLPTTLPASLLAR